jgi:hypothetical protein
VRLGLRPARPTPRNASIHPAISKRFSWIWRSSFSEGSNWARHSQQNASEGARRFKSRPLSRQAGLRRGPHSLRTKASPKSDERRLEAHFRLQHFIEHASPFARRTKTPSPLFLLFSKRIGFGERTILRTIRIIRKKTAEGAPGCFCTCTVLRTAGVAVKERLFIQRETGLARVPWRANSACWEIAAQKSHSPAPPAAT